MRNSEMGEIKLREMNKLLFFSLLVLLLLSGCNSNDRNINNDIFQFKDSFVGDNSASRKHCESTTRGEAIKRF